MNTKSGNALIVLALATIVLLPRVFDLGQFNTADEKRWLANTTNFTAALAHGRWDNLFQQPHPGVTMLWLAAPTVYADSWAVRKLPLTVSQSILVLMIGYIFHLAWGGRAATALTLLLALNPMLIAQTRVYAMDSLLALFLLLSLGCLFLWNKNRKTRYLIYSAIAGALAVLSKLPGIIIAPFAVVYIIYCHLTKTGNGYRLQAGSYKPVIVWFLAFFITLPIVLPSLITNFTPVMQDIVGFFSSGDYVELHPEPLFYYLRTLAFFSTPLQIAALIALPLLWPKLAREQKEHFIVLLVFAASFIIMMSVGVKKGDRYILPGFLALDTIAALIITTTLSIRLKTKLFFLFSFFFFLSIAIQAIEIWRLHPYTLAYVNPITKPFFDDRRLGWGEGLDLAAEYLNAKPNAHRLKAAAFYPIEFSTRFSGKTIPLHEWDNGTADYAVLYRAMYERGPDAWETDVLNQFKEKSPDNIIKLNGIEYVWIYRIK